jgi:FkbM family methyltransferase
MDSETREQTVDGTTARFETSTERETRRIETLMKETEILEDVLSTVQADDVFYDIGANVGVYTCVVGQRADQTVAVEPHSQTVARLRENADLNDVDADIYEYALSDRSGTATLEHPGRSPMALGSGEFSLAPVEDPDRVEETELIAGDELVERESLPEPTVAKIDVEGAELAVIDGLAKTLENCRALYIEVHRDHVDVADVTARLRVLGFDYAALKERGNTTFLRATAE